MQKNSRYICPFDLLYTFEVWFLIIYKTLLSGNEILDKFALSKYNITFLTVNDILKIRTYIKNSTLP